MAEFDTENDVFKSVVDSRQTSALTLTLTCGGSGIGRATVIEFAKAGYNVVLTGRTKSKLEATVDLCKAEGLKDDEVFIAVGDVTETADNTRIVNDTLDKFGRIDVLVNNAGILDSKSFSDYPLELLDKMYNTLLRGVFDLTQKAMPHLLKTKGNVINVSSVAAEMANNAFLGYAMVKAALDHFTRAISVDYAPKGVRVNTVNPGFARSDIVDGFYPPDELNAVWEKFGKCHPIGKLVTATAVAKLILFLASDDASFITGANVPIDGSYRNTMALPQ